MILYKGLDMMRVLWLLAVFSLRNFVHSLNRFSEPNFKAINFAAEAIKGHKLNGSVIKEIEVSSEISCQFECVANKNCLSYNFASIQGKEAYTCQLSDSDRFVGHANFTREDGVIYRGTQSVCERNFLCAENESCLADYKSHQANSHNFCKCFKGHLECPRNCHDHYRNGSRTNGLYFVYPDNGDPIQVPCDMTTEGGGWTVFQRRMDGTVDFYLDWESYRRGFGNLNGEFWLGNDNLYRLTASANMMLRVDLEDYNAVRKYAEYTTFSVAGASDSYRLMIDGYRGTAGDSMATSCSRPAKAMMFTTKDRDNDVKGHANCAVQYRGAWWYHVCHCSNLNGLYRGGGHAQGVVWMSFKGLDYSLEHVEMKMRPNTA